MLGPSIAISGVALAPLAALGALRMGVDRPTSFAALGLAAAESALFLYALFRMSA
jgi:hypothetical protein